jgi:hypothetical protein
MSGLYHRNYSSLESLIDVNFTDLADGEAVVYNSTTGVFENQSVGGSLGVCIITETQTANTASAVTYTDSGSTSAQTKPRRFNTKVEGGLTITLNGSPDFTFTISSAGTYLFEGSALLSVPSSDGQTIFAKLFLNNQTDGLGSAIVGVSFRYGPVSSSQLTNTNLPCFINGILTITGTKVFSLDHSVISQNFHPTGGKASNILSATEVYATLKITKIA